MKRLVANTCLVVAAWVVLMAITLAIVWFGRGHTFNETHTEIRAGRICAVTVGFWGSETKVLCAEGHGP